MSPRPPPQNTKHARLRRRRRRRPPQEPPRESSTRSWNRTTTRLKRRIEDHYYDREEEDAQRNARMYDAGRFPVVVDDIGATTTTTTAMTIPDMRTSTTDIDTVLRATTDTNIDAPPAVLHHKPSRNLFNPSTPPSHSPFLFLSLSFLLTIPSVV